MRYKFYVFQKCRHFSSLYLCYFRTKTKLLRCKGNHHGHYNIRVLQYSYSNHNNACVDIYFSFVFFKNPLLSVGTVIYCTNNIGEKK